MFQNFNNSKICNNKNYLISGDILFERENQIARFYDVLSETEDTISYAEHIDPKKILYMWYGL